MAGATVMLSPVCTPIGSRFSIGHTMTTLSLRSRITSSSYSFHPINDRSMSTWPTGLIAKAHSIQHTNGFVSVVSRSALRHPQPNPLHRLLEGVAILRLMNGIRRGTDQGHAVFL